MRSTILTLLSITLIGFLFTSCEKKDENKQKVLNKEIIRPVIVIKAKVKDAKSNKVFAGISKAHEQIKLSFKVKGNINKFDLNIGDFIKKGSFIASLDKKPYEIEMKKASFALIEAKVKLKNAKSSYERVKKLYINQNSSQSDLDNAQANYYAIKASVSKAQESLSFSKLQLSYTSLYAPKSGFVAVKYVQKNENVNTGSSLILLSDENVLDVSAQIPDNFINSIHKDDEVFLSFDSIKNESFKAKVSELSKIASLNLKTFEVRVKLLKKDKRVKAGMAARITFFNKNENLNILEVPSASVLNDAKGYFVYTAKPYKDNLAKIKRVDIKVGKLSSNGFEVLSGLSKDDLVLKAGMSQVFEDLIVELR